MVKILMMSAKRATPGLPKAITFSNKVFNVIISIHEVTNRVLSCDSTYIIDLFM